MINCIGISCDACWVCTQGLRPNMAVLAEVGRYPMAVKAAKHLCNFWNRLVEMDDGRLVKQAFLQSAVLGPLTHSNSAHKSWAGQVVSFLATLGMPCDLSTPQSVNVSAVVEKLQSSYLESVNACSGVKMQQYLHLRSEVDSASYTPAAYLQAVGGWRQRKHLAQLRTGSHWLAVETGRYGNARVEQAQRLCQRCDANSVDDVEHMIFDCVAMDVERQKHRSLFARGRVALVDFFIQDPTELATFVHDCCKACKE